MRERAPAAASKTIRPAEPAICCSLERPDVLLNEYKARPVFGRLRIFLRTQEIFGYCGANGDDPHQFLIGTIPRSH